jgi:hypothetical protein
MPQFKKYFTASIRSRYPSNAESLLIELDKEFDLLLPDVKFAATSKNPMDRRLVFCAYFLALIKVLDHHGESFEQIRVVSLDVVKEFVRPKNGFQRFMKKLPPKLIKFRVTNAALKFLAKKLSTKGHPDGFVLEVIFDKKETYGLGYGIDILECGICKLFNKHGFKKYAPILCEVDEVTSNLAGLKLIRSGTIANGASKCDFRYTPRPGT